MVYDNPMEDAIEKVEVGTNKDPSSFSNNDQREYSDESDSAGSEVPEEP